MAISLLRGRGTRRRESVDNGIAIGETDAVVESCPACGRPLDGASLTVCPGCGTRLLLGVPASKAGVFTAFGAVVGLLVGGLVIGSVASMTRPAAVSVAAAEDPGGSAGNASSEPSSSSSQGRTLNVPSTSVAALRQTVTINQRILASVPLLEAQAVEKAPDAQAIAGALRAIAADAASGSDLVTRIVFWKEADGVKASLQRLYASIRSTAREGLAASMTNAKAYKVASKRMLSVLAGVATVDVQTQQLAEQTGISIPSALYPQ